jgi:hypothetical protein
MHMADISLLRVAYSSISQFGLRVQVVVLDMIFSILKILNKLYSTYINQLGSTVLPQHLPLYFLWSCTRASGRLSSGSEETVQRNREAVGNTPFLNCTGTTGLVVLSYVRTTYLQDAMLAWCFPGKKSYIHYWYWLITVVDINISGLIIRYQ